VRGRKKGSERTTRCRAVGLGPDNLSKLMKLSYDPNYVRVCIDNDDGLIVMAQRRDVWLNADEFKTTVSQVSADRAYVIMRPSLVAP